MTGASRGGGSDRFKPANGPLPPAAGRQPPAGSAPPFLAVEALTKRFAGVVAMLFLDILRAILGHEEAL